MVIRLYLPRIRDCEVRNENKKLYRERPTRTVADLGISFGGWANDKGGQKPAAGEKIFLKSRLL